MKTNSFSANAIGGRGGLFDSGAQAIKDALLAYFQSQRNERQDERQLKRDERQFGRQQRQDALALAERLGVRPAVEDTGWLGPHDEDAIGAALAERARKLALADKSNAQGDAMAQLALRARRLELAKAGALLPDSGDLLGDQDVVEATAASQGAEERRLKIEALRRSLLPKPAPQVSERSGWAPFRAKDGSPWLYDRQTGAVKPAIPSSTDGGHASTAPSSPGLPAPVVVGDTGPGLLSRQLQKIEDYWTGPTLTPRWSQPDGMAPARPTALPAPLPIPSAAPQVSTIAPEQRRGPSPLDDLRQMPAETRRAYLRDLSQRDPATFAAIRQQLTGQ